MIFVQRVVSTRVDDPLCISKEVSLGAVPPWFFELVMISGYARVRAQRLRGCSQGGRDGRVTDADGVRQGVARAGGTDAGVVPGGGGGTGAVCREAAGPADRSRGAGVSAVSHPGTTPGVEPLQRSGAGAAVLLPHDPGPLAYTLHHSGAQAALQAAGDLQPGGGEPLAWGGPPLEAPGVVNDPVRGGPAGERGGGPASGRSRWGTPCDSCTARQRRPGSLYAPVRATADRTARLLAGGSPPAVAVPDPGWAAADAHRDRAEDLRTR